MSNLQTRIISGLVMLGFALFALFEGGWVWRIFVAVIGVGLVVEWCNLVKLYPVRPMTALLGFSVLAIVVVGEALSYYYAFWVLGACILAAALIYRFDRRSLLLAGGLCYIAFPLMALLWLRALPEYIGFIVTTWMFLTIWATDIFAYFAGRSIGGPKLFPIISPKKTWAGFFGALFGAILVAWGCHWGFGLTGSITGLIFAGVSVSILSQAGDALESAIKRDMGVKDSGHIIPGHGGFFDRLDGLLVVAPIVAAALAYADTGVNI